MRFKQIFLCLAVLFFLGCEDKKIDSDIISKGVSSSKEAKEAHQNIDRNSYAEILPYLKDNRVIESDGAKVVLLMFGSNGCKYCDKLKNEIKESKELQNQIKNDFFSYYINTSYQKTHSFFSQNLDTQDLAESFAIRSTPTLIFLNPKGELIFEIVGFMGGEKLKLALEYIAKNPNLTQEQISENLYNLFAKKSLF